MSTVEYKYDLHLLGWSSFQQLCLSITREILGQTVESFLGTTDGGRDGAFIGAWEQKGQETVSGKFVIQCKFTSKKEATFKLKDISAEFPKIERLVDKRLCDCYIILTNAGISGQQKEKIEDELKRIGVKNVLCFGSTWICQQIHENRNLRTSIPRLYGLGDLSQIIDSRAYAQAKALLASLQDDLAKIVITDAYRKASKAISEHGFVLLIGEPAAGKTTIASMLSMAALDQWGALTMKLDTPAKVVDHWNPDNPTQLFWIDDAFGVTQYESSLVHGWNHAFAQVKTMLKQGVKIVMTSRDYIYSRARNDLKESAFPFIQESQVVIDVHKLTIEEKKQILYNHLKLGRQIKKFKTHIKPFLEKVAANDRFVPETARRLSEPVFTKELVISEYWLQEFVEKQMQFLQEVIRGLDKDSQAALGLIYMRNNNLESPIELTDPERKAIERMGSSLAGSLQALNALKGSLVQHLNLNDAVIWSYKHPTVGDAFAMLLINSPDLLGIYLQGSSVEKLLTQITCGDVGLENAVVIPKNLYSIILNKLAAFTRSKEYKSQHLSVWGAKWLLLNFLSDRCSKEFLLAYIDKNPKILAEVSSPGLYLHASTELDLALKLHELRILPEENRLQLITNLTDYAVNGEDLYALESENVQRLYTHEELQLLKDKIQSELPDKLSEIRESLEYNFSRDADDPQDYMDGYLSTLKTLKNIYGENNLIAGMVKEERSLVDVWILENRDTDNERPKRELADVKEIEEVATVRSIFDDVDE